MFDEARKEYREALKFYRRLADAHPETFVPILAGDLDKLAAVSAEQEDALEEAGTAVNEALLIRRKLWDRKPGKYGDDVAASLVTKAVVRGKQGAGCDEIAALVEEATKLSSLDSVKRDAKEATEECAGK